MNNSSEMENGIIRLFTAGIRTGLIVVAIVTVVSMTALAQTTEPAVEHVPAADKQAVADVSPMGDENGAEDNTSVQTGLFTTPVTPTVVDIEIQRRFNELRRELLADRVSIFDWQLTITAIALSLVFGIVGFLGFRRFREIEITARKGAESAAKHAEDAERCVREIEENRNISQEIIRDIRGISAEVAANNPGKASQAVRIVTENPRASLINKAIARAVSLQQEGRRKDAIEKWRAIAHVAEENDKDISARAWFSVGYLIPDENPEDCIFANDQALRLKPDFAEAYNNRGYAKGDLGRHGAALIDYDEAIRLKPGVAEVYNNRGVTKKALGQHDDALADYDEAIRLKPDYAEAYKNRGSTKGELGRHDDALTDYDKAISLKSDYAEAYNDRGYVKKALGRHDDALADYDKAIRLKPELTLAYINRGILKAELGREEEARRDFETALELARNTNKADMMTRAEQLLRDLDLDGGP